MKPAGLTKLLSTTSLKVSVFVAMLSSTAYAVTAPTGLSRTKAKVSRKIVTYQQDLTAFQSKLSLQISSVERLIALSDQDITKRLNDASKDPRIEPMQLTISAEDEKILDLAGRVAKPGKKLALAHYLRENFTNGEAVPGTDLKLVNLDPKSYEWLDRDSVDQLFAKEHSELTLKTDNLRRSTTLRDQFVHQLLPYLSPAQLQQVKQKIAAGRPLLVDRDLLPKFPKGMIRHHTIFKGPNCFHAALSFQSPELSRSSLVNVREEPGYHRSMINYDEMWRIAQLEFYEIDPKKSDIQYGDMILFFDAPKEPQTAVDFKTLRHAATYLFNGYVFAKGSKSANSPYLVKPLADEWSTWTKYTENLGVKVFRRNLKRVNKAALWEPHDWMY